MNPHNITPSSAPDKKRLSKKILLCLPEDLLAAVDKEAKDYYMTRSDLMRRALIWYLRPAAQKRRQDGEKEDEELQNLNTNPQELLKILQDQKLRAGIDKLLRNMRKRQQAARDAKKRAIAINKK